MAVWWLRLTAVRAEQWRASSQEERVGSDRRALTRLAVWAGVAQLLPQV